MRRIAAFVFWFLAVAALVGCTHFINSYTFGKPAFSHDGWRQDYPRDSDTGTVKCQYVNRHTYATIKVIEDPCDKPDVLRSAQAMYRMYRESGYDVGTVMLCDGPGGKYASFTYARGAERGRVVAVRRPNVLKTFMLIGSWTAADDVTSNADIEALAREFEVDAERMPVE